MLTTEKGLRDLWSRSLVKDLTASGQVAVGRGYILGVTYTGAAAADSGTLIDGFATGDPILDIMVLTGAMTFPHPMVWPRPFVRGLYVLFGATMAHVTVHYVLHRNIDAE